MHIPHRCCSSRRQFVQRLTLAAPALAWASDFDVWAAERRPGSPAPASPPRTVRDCFWAWAHDAHCYDDSYGLPRNGRITPVEGAYYLGVPNIILVRYGGKPAPPFEQYAIPFKSLKRVHWSITGAGGATSDEERNYVLQLAAAMPNLTGVFMDDFFHLGPDEETANWLAENNVSFPVFLTVALPTPARPTQLELAQSAWHSGDYRCKDIAVDLAVGGGDWQETARIQLPNTPGAIRQVPLPGTSIQGLRLRILSTHDITGAMSCGLRRLRLRTAAGEIPLQDATVRASSTYPGHDANQVLIDKKKAAGEAPAALGVEQLRRIRKQLDQVQGRRLDLGVTLYTHQLDRCILPHLEFCDVISLWTWNFEDLKDLEANFAKLKAMAPRQRIWLGAYMWGFGSGKPIPITLMRRQCELGHQWLKQGRIDGMIFLATNICDLGLEAVEWCRQWIAQVGDQSL